MKLSMGRASSPLTRPKAHAPSHEAGLPGVAAIPWWQRLAFFYPARPYVIPATVGIVMALVVGLLDLVFGSGHASDIRGLITPLFMANAVWGAAYVMRGTLGTIRDLRPWLRDGENAVDDLHAQTLGVSIKVAVVATVIGPLVMVPLRGLRHGSPVHFYREDPTNFVITILVWLFLGPVVFHSVLIVRTLLEAGRRLEVDLLSLDALTGFGRVGLRFVLTVGVGSALIGMQAWVAEAPGGATFAGGLSFSWLLLCGAMLLLPSLTVRASIRARKTAELDAIERGLQGDSAASSKLAVARSGPPPSGLDLLLYRDWVRELPDWPINSPTLRRFALYLLIPVGSWLGGALVELLVDRAVG